ncbi:1-acyl-sn-glycerol-3-phosphate acyltransferase [Crinalium epipsammum PCC 9333]|uniref:1-acyl-sn-glycerol-3-phosphate acyltransferase n=1 Tax=Crinalium epipsammum PCC 9333 TaxID=1173022 RepID=K9VZQ3_9CYAN|nr:lysophospholipid acyltransferase family protein [Crinalium epipsammum]AFZ13461.1 1-acyl-sn-glycerol-3-phosphate acyltransferase [Crinalium epipsammum PCC 9333]
MQPIEPSRSREPFVSLVLYRAFKWSIIVPALRVYFNAQVYGAENVPTQGPLLVVSNHASDFDPLILSSCVGRPVAYMAKEELFQVPILKQAITLYGAYPVKRGSADRSAIRAALASIEAGWAAGIFLEGTRTQDARIYSPKLGATMIAAKANAPLLPVSLWGTEKILKKGSAIPQKVPITVRIGELIPAPKSSKRDELEAVTQKCADVINAMHDLGR